MGNSPVCVTAGEAIPPAVRNQLSSDPANNLLGELGRICDRVVVIDPMSTKGLEYDATVIVDPDEIAAESPGGVRVLYVALTRAAHRMTVLRPA